MDREGGNVARTTRKGKVQGDVFDAWAYASSLDGDEC
jgi:hypothetical protein